MTEGTPLTPPTRNDVTEGMLRAGRGLGNASAMLNHACAERLGLHATDWECVGLLDEARPEALTAGRLAELTGLTTGAITGVIDRLEAKGFVRRVRDPADRRRVNVELQEGSLDAAQPILSGMIGDMIALQAEFPTEDVARFVELLDRAASILRSHALALRRERAPDRGGQASASS